MAILRFRKLTRAQFDALDVRDLNTRYTVVEPDGTLVEYIGEQPISIGDNEINSKRIKTLYELNPDTNVFNDTSKDKLESIEAGAQVNPTAPVIKMQYESNANTNAFTDVEKSKLESIEAGAEVNVKSDWNATTGDAEILNKPTPDQFLGVSDVGYIKRIDENTFEIDGNTYVTEGSFNLQLLEKQNNKPDGTNQLIVNGKLNSVYIDSLYASDIVEVDTVDEMLLLEDMKRGDIVIVRGVETTYILKQEPSNDVDNWASFLVQPAVVSVNGKVGIVQIGISDIENLQGILNSKLNISIFEDELVILNNSLNAKVDKVVGKGLSTNDYTNVDKSKVDLIETDGDGTKYFGDDGQYHDKSINVTKSMVEEVLTGTITTHTHNASDIIEDATHRLVTDTEKSTWNAKQEALGFTPENVANKKTTLTDSDVDYPTTKAVKAAIDAAISQTLKPMGNWNASTNTPELTDSDMSKSNQIYYVNVAGTQFGINFEVGDELVYNTNGIMFKRDNAGAVISVNGKQGVVVLTQDDIADGSTYKRVTDTEKTTWNNKVDKVAGKGLSTEDYTTAEKDKLSDIESGAQVNTVTSVAGKTGVVSLTADDIDFNGDGTNYLTAETEAEGALKKLDQAIMEIDYINVQNQDTSEMQKLRLYIVGGQIGYDVEGE